MSDELEQEIEEQTEPASAEDKFAEKIAEINKPTEPVDADPEPEPEEQPEPEQPKVEGPSLAMKRAAREAGLSDKVIAAAVDDAQLDLLIEEIATRREAEKQPEPEKEPELANLLPEDEFPKDDPVRNQVDAIISKVQQLEGYLGQLAGIALETEKAIKATTESQVVEETTSFDDFIDTLEHPVLGSRKDEKVTNAGHLQRQAIYWTFKELEAEHPRTAKAKLMEQAAAEHGYPTKTLKRQEAIADDSRKRLGGGPSKAVSEPQPVGKELAIKRMQEILNGRKE